jgi:AcrR family transcriptional regulator
MDANVGDPYLDRMPPPRRPRRRAGESVERKTQSDRRIELLQATREVITEGGLAHVTMERVALKAGVSKPVVYSCFDNRGALLVALLEEFWSGIDTQLGPNEALADLDSFNEAVVRAYFKQLSQGGRALAELLSAGTEEPEVAEARQHRFKSVEVIWSQRYESTLGLEKPISTAAAAILRNALAGAGAFWIGNRSVNQSVCVKVCLTVLHGALTELQAEYGKPSS